MPGGSWKDAPDPLHGMIATTINGKPAIVEYEPDTDLRDTEQIPLLEEGGIRAFLRLCKETIDESEGEKTRYCPMRRMRGMLKIASRLATRSVLLVIFTSRNRCGRWRKFAFTSWNIRWSIFDTKKLA